MESKYTNYFAITNKRIKFVFCYGMIVMTILRICNQFKFCWYELVNKL